ncbi:MAG: L,D-transpeptidase family protein [Bauldia sp.]
MAGSVTSRRRTSLVSKVAGLALAATMLVGCNTTELPAYMAPIPPELMSRIEAIGSTPMAPIYVRIFKEESVFEVWKRRVDGEYALLATYEICAWSGELGPKRVEGDRQAPEGFYTVTPAQLNPNSSYHLSFDLGYPNAFDRSLDRTGSHLMVHGACSSAGCYSMTDETVEIIYALVREAFRGGQRAFQVHAFPFRMTPENMARHRGNENFAFWQMLKEGYDHFEVTHLPPDVEVCDFRYVFDPVAEDGAAFEPRQPCPDFDLAQPLETQLLALRSADQIRFDAAVATLENGGTLLAGMPATATALVDPMTTAAVPAAPRQPSAFRQFFGLD